MRIFALILLASAALLPLGATAAERDLLSCLLEPSSEISLSSAETGVVKKVYTERGAEVKKGQLLVLLDNAHKKAELKAAKSRADFTQRKLDRNKELLDQDLLSDFEQDELVTEHHLAKLEVKESELALSRREIRSPIHGIVVDRHVSIGEYVGTDPVLDLVALDPIHVEVVMRATRYGEIKNGMLVNVDTLIPGSNNIKGRYQGKITVVDKVIDAASGTFGFRVEIPNNALQIPAGIKCQISLAPRK